MNKIFEKTPSLLFWYFVNMPVALLLAFLSYRMVILLFYDNIHTLIQRNIDPEFSWPGFVVHGLVALLFSLLPIAMLSFIPAFPFLKIEKQPKCSTPKLWSWLVMLGMIGYASYRMFSSATMIEKGIIFFVTLVVVYVHASGILTEWRPRRRSALTTKERVVQSLMNNHGMTREEAEQDYESSNL
jgi:predicted lysophospholipase L1 biosynthesis ABC-type transport system permease subunit